MKTKLTNEVGFNSESFTFLISKIKLKKDYLCLILNKDTN